MSRDRAQQQAGGQALSGASRMNPDRALTVVPHVDEQVPSDVWPLTHRQTEFEETAAGLWVDHHGSLGHRWIETADSLPVEWFMACERLILPNCRGWRREMLATSPISVDGHVCHDPLRPSVCPVQSESHNSLVGRRVLSGGQFRQINKPVVAVIAVANYRANDGCGYDSDSGNDRPQLRIDLHNFASCLRSDSTNLLSPEADPNR